MCDLITAKEAREKTNKVVEEENAKREKQKREREEAILERTTAAFEILGKIANENISKAIEEGQYETTFNVPDKFFELMDGLGINNTVYMYFSTRGYNCEITFGSKRIIRINWKR